VAPSNFTAGAVQFASVSEPRSGKARKRVEQPRRMAVVGKKLSVRLCASRWHTGMGSNLIYGLDWTGSGRADCTATLQDKLLKLFHAISEYMNVH